MCGYGTGCVGNLVIGDAMVRIEYINGDVETVETVKNNTYSGHFIYEKDSECFVIFDKSKYHDCMCVPREFAKSIRCIDEDN